MIDGANYLGVGQTFTSRTKSFDTCPGLDFVRQVAAEIRLPAFAIGGIDATNVGEVVAAGLRQVAVSSAVAGNAQLRAVVEALREGLRQRHPSEAKRMGRGFSRIRRMSADE